MSPSSVPLLAASAEEEASFSVPPDSSTPASEPEGRHSESEDIATVAHTIPEKYKGKMEDDNMLHQMQKLIAMFELSERSDYDPRGFCFSFKEFDGTPTNNFE